MTDTSAAEPERLSISEVYAAHRLGLVRLAILLVDDLPTAEDVVQDAFAGLVGRYGDGADVNNLMSYLRKAVVNNAGSVLRRRRVARAYVAPYEPAVNGPESNAILADEHREVLAALRRLSPRQREVLVLRYWEGRSEAEIAEILGISQGTVKSTVSRALVALNEHLALAV